MAIVAVSESSPRQEAVNILGKLLDDYSSGTPDLVQALRRLLHAARLAGSAQLAEWAELELGGYPDQRVPKYRNVEAFRNWIGKGNQEAITLQVAQSFGQFPLPPPEFVPTVVQDSVVRLIAARQNGLPRGIVAERTVALNYLIPQSVATCQTDRITGPVVDGILHAIEQAVFDYASRSVIALRFGNAAGTIFDRYRDSVEPALARMGLSAELDGMTRSLEAGTMAANGLACLAARNLVASLANRLWQAQGDEYPHIKNKAGTGNMRVTSNEPRNRLRAYLHQKGIKTDELLHAKLDAATGVVDALYNAQSAGKGEVSRGDAEYVVIETYVLIGEIARNTDLVPVTAIRQPA